MITADRLETLRRPLYYVGAMLEGKAVHPGRSALFALFVAYAVVTLAAAAAVLVRRDA